MHYRKTNRSQTRLDQRRKNYEYMQSMRTPQHTKNSFFYHIPHAKHHCNTLNAQYYGKQEKFTMMVETTRTQLLNELNTNNQQQNSAK